MCILTFVSYELIKIICFYYHESGNDTCFIVDSTRVSFRIFVKGAKATIAIVVHVLWYFYEHICESMLLWYLRNRLEILAYYRPKFTTCICIVYARYMYTYIPCSYLLEEK